MTSPEVQSTTLSGKRAVITGASQGIGFGIASAYVRAGAEILICARTQSDLESAKTRLMDTTPNAKVSIVEADVSVEADVANVERCARELWDELDVLVCCAGIHGPKGAIDEVCWNEWAHAIAVNLHGPVLCCRAFLPMLKQARHGKIILMSGGGATKPFPYISAYAASKAALVRYGETLAEEMKPFEIDVNMVAPGAVNTRLLDGVLEAGPEKVGEAHYRDALRQRETGGTPPERSADLCVYLGSDASDGITGKLISAVWDPWKDFGEHLRELQSTDVYTLRRIVPSDRGMTWG